MKHMKSAMGILAVVITVSIASIAFAFCGDGSGYGGNMMGNGGGYGGGNGYAMGPGMMGYGPGYRHMNGYYGSNGYGNLSREDAAKLEQSQQKFFYDTSSLRNSIRDKQFALNDELQKPDPDGAKVIDLQKQLSQLESQFDQKALAHRLELRKEFPQAN
jgi:Spy/CpxP family protein refolding chaperone